MNIFRMVLAVLLPPLAVWDKGCGTVLMVGLLTLLFWIPGAVVAMYIVVRDTQRTSRPIQARSTGIVSTAQDLKSRPITTTPANTPFDPAPPFSAQPATPADPFAASTPPTPRPSSPFQSKPPNWTENPPATPADPFDEPPDTSPPAPQPPARPKAPWES